MPSELKHHFKIVASQRGLSVILWVLLFSISLLPTSSAQTSLVDPKKSAALITLKTELTVRFLQFTSWDKSKFVKGHSPIILGILDSGSRESSWKKIAGRSVQGHPIQLKFIKGTSDLQGCHAVFFSAGDDHKFLEYKSKLQQSQILSIVEGKGMARKGAIISLYFHKSRPKIEINRQAAQKSSIELKASLLKLAQLVEGGS